MFFFFAHRCVNIRETRHDTQKTRLSHAVVWYVEMHRLLTSKRDKSASNSLQWWLRGGTLRKFDEFQWAESQFVQSSRCITPVWNNVRKYGSQKHTLSTKKQLLEIIWLFYLLGQNIILTNRLFEHKQWAIDARGNLLWRAVGSRPGLHRTHREDKSCLLQLENVSIMSIMYPLL